MPGAASTRTAQQADTDIDLYSSGAGSGVMISGDGTSAGGLQEHNHHEQHQIR
jgi:hypothetical protein